MVIAARQRVNPEGLNLSENLIQIRRTAKVVKGGKRMRFSALVVVGDGEGHVGVGLGKDPEVPEAIRKAAYYAKKELIQVPLAGTTIPYQVVARAGAARVILKPAGPGTGVIAAGGVRAVLQAAGVKDVLTKSLGSDNPINVTRATFLGLFQLRQPQEVLAQRKPSSQEAPSE